MPKQTLTLVILNVTLICVVCFAQKVPGRRVYCYFRNFGSTFTVKDIDPSLCTHIGFAFVKLIDDDIGNPTEVVPENDNDTVLYKELLLLKIHHPLLRLSFSIGGGLQNQSKFSVMARNSNHRLKFSENVALFVRRYSFDGVDIDWEFPTRTDRPYATALFKDLSNTLATRGNKYRGIPYELSAALAAGYLQAQISCQITEVFKYLDFANIMVYDLHGPWDHFTDNHAPLYGRKGTSGYPHNLNGNYSIHYYLKNDAPADKINFGIPLYGRGYTLKYTSEDGVGAPINGSGSPPSRSYRTICDFIKTGGWERHWIAEEKAPYVVGPNAQWIGYDDIDSVKLKVDYIRNMELGGAMVWDLGQDDYRNICGDGKYPLLSEISIIRKDIAEKDISSLVKKLFVSR